MSESKMKDKNAESPNLSGLQDPEHELPPHVEGDEMVEEQTAAAEVEALRNERDALLDRLARLQADFENFRKRSAREQSDYRDYALTDTLRGLLPILDSFDLALKADAPDQGLRSGVELIRRQMEDLLGRLGAQPVPAAGEPFDPRFHEAIEMVETEEAPDNHVIEELQRGYRIKDRLLRPAMVRVARNPKP